MSKTEETNESTTDNQQAGQPGFLSCMAAGVKPVCTEFAFIWKPGLQVLISLTGLLSFLFLFLCYVYDKGVEAMNKERPDWDSILPDDSMLPLCVGLTCATTLAQLAFIGWLIFS